MNHEELYHNIQQLIVENPFLRDFTATNLERDHHHENTSYVEG